MTPLLAGFIGFGVDLGVHHIGVCPRRSLVNRCEGLTGPTVCSPKVNQHKRIFDNG